MLWEELRRWPWINYDLLCRCSKLLPLMLIAGKLQNIYVREIRVSSSSNSLMNQCMMWTQPWLEGWRAESRERGFTEELLYQRGMSESSSRLVTDRRGKSRNKLTCTYSAILFLKPHRQVNRLNWQNCFQLLLFGAVFDPEKRSQTAWLWIQPLT